MKMQSLADHRLVSQHIGSKPFATAAKAVRWMGAVQAQDYLGSLWAVALRTKKATEATIEQAIADRSIVRTWPMRGTLHYVAPENVHWMLDLLAPRVLKRAASIYRQAELDEKVFNKSAKVIESTLSKEKIMTRKEVYSELEQARISTHGLRGILILGNLAQQGLICCGPRQGKQPTFVLLDEWITKGKILTQEEAFAQLATWYFFSHGPATLHDFAWWTGLTLTEAKTATELVKHDLTEELIEGKAYWWKQSRPLKVRPASFLLPAFDEYLVAYKDRNAAVDPAHVKFIRHAANGLLSPVLLRNGKIAGTWKRTVHKEEVEIAVRYFSRTAKDNILLEQEIKRFGKFLGWPARLK